MCSMTPVVIKLFSGGFSWLYLSLWFAFVDDGERPSGGYF